MLNKSAIEQCQINSPCGDDDGDVDQAGTEAVTELAEAALPVLSFESGRSELRVPPARRGSLEERHTARRATVCSHRWTARSTERRRPFADVVVHGDSQDDVGMDGWMGRMEEKEEWGGPATMEKKEEEEASRGE